MNSKLFFVLNIFIFCFHCIGYTQTDSIVVDKKDDKLIQKKNNKEITYFGYVKDLQTKEPISYCNVFFANSNIGALTDENGFFEINVYRDKNVDSIGFTYLGYKDFFYKFKKIIKEKDTIEVYLSPEGLKLDEIVIKAKRKVREKDTLAIRIFRSVVANKSINKPKKYDSYSFDEYTKTQLSLYNVKSSLAKKKILRPFSFILQNIDSTQDGVKFIPLILKEKITSNYHNTNPNKDKQVVLAQKISGVEQAGISNMLDEVFDESDVYGNQLILNGKGFTCPFADGGLFSYNYYVVDSTKDKDSFMTYKLAFAPKIKGDLAFIGYAWITSNNWAIMNIDLSIDKRANLNFINDFSLKQSFTFFDNKGWFRTDEIRTTQLSYSKRKKSKSVRFQRNTIRQNLHINEPIADTLLKGEPIEFVKNYKRKTDSFWITNRFDTLKATETNVYWMIDSLKRTKAYKIYYGIGKTIASGYYTIKPVEFGHFLQLFSYNDVEGNRFRLGMRSNYRMSEKYWFRVYGAYGTKDKKFKYGATFIAQMPGKKWNQITASYKDDYQRFSLLKRDDEYDYITYSLLRSSKIADLVYVKDAALTYEKDWGKSVRTSVLLNYKIYQSIAGKIEFKKTLPDSSVISYNNFNVFSPRINLSFTPGAKFRGGTAFKQTFFKGNKPRINLAYTFAIKDVLKTGFTFHKLDVSMEQNFPWKLGKTKYLLVASKLFGNAPYPLITLHPGNESFLQNYYRFNMMHEFEFASDQQVSLFFEHHFEGFFLNKIPLIKKLQMREVFICKMSYGGLNKEKVSFTDLPTGLKGINGYYAEIGFGIENIAKIFRVDFLWRMTQKDAPDYKRFKVLLAFSPGF